MAALATFLFVLLGGFLFPWWWPALAGYLAGFWLGRGGGKAFLAGFIGAAAAWLALAAFLDWRNHHLLSGKMAALMGLPTPLLLLFLSAVIGGLLGGLGAWAGQSLRDWLRQRKRGEIREPF